MAEEDIADQSTTEDEETEETEPEAGNESEGAGSEKGKKKKKIVKRRKSRKENEQPVMSALRLTVESGKVDFGARSAIASKGKAKAYVVAQNTPAKAGSQIAKIAADASVPILVFEGNTMELGSVCGKPFPISVLTVYDAGSSHLMDLVKKK